MAEYYRIKIDDTGKTFIVDEDGNKLDPDKHRNIASSLSNTISRNSFVYMGCDLQTGFYKIGVSYDPDRRAKEVGIEIYTTIQCDPWGKYSAFELEKFLHTMYGAIGQHIKGEWFELDLIDIFWLHQLHFRSDVASVFETVENMLKFITSEDAYKVDMDGAFPFISGRVYSLRDKSPNFMFTELYLRKSHLHWVGANGGAIFAAVSYLRVLKLAKALFFAKGNKATFLENATGFMEGEFRSVEIDLETKS